MRSPGIISTQNLTNRNGKWNWFAIGFFVLLGGSLVFQVVESFLTIRQMRKAEAEQQKKIAELELNLKQALGDAYKTIT